ncbi:hypothetical protein [Paenibacillus sp. sptzw28]|nr:hypothetical protein [Paenibacillus sp. sptzw28]
MLTFPSNQRVFLACGSTDLCKSIDGLAGVNGSGKIPNNGT